MKCLEDIKMKDVMIVTGAGQISMAIARRMGYGMKIVMGDKSIENAINIAKIMNDAGFDVIPFQMDLASKESILELIAEAQKYGDITMLVNGAGVSPSQASIEMILKVDLYGTAVLLEEVGKVIEEGGVGVTISSTRARNPQGPGSRHVRRMGWRLRPGRAHRGTETRGQRLPGQAEVRAVPEPARTDERGEAVHRHDHQRRHPAATARTGAGARPSAHHRPAEGGDGGTVRQGGPRARRRRAA